MAAKKAVCGKNTETAGQNYFFVNDKNSVTGYSKLPPPRTSGFCVRKPLPVSWGGGVICENPGCRDFKIFFTAEFSHFLVTIFLTDVIIGEPYVKIPGTGISNPGTGKILGTGISNPSTGKKSWVPGFQTPGTGKKSWVPGFQIQY